MIFRARCTCFHIYSYLLTLFCLCSRAQASRRTLLHKLLISLGILNEHSFFSRGGTVLSLAKASPIKKLNFNNNYRINHCSSQVCGMFQKIACVVCPNRSSLFLRDHHCSSQISGVSQQIQSLTDHHCSTQISGVPQQIVTPYRHSDDTPSSGLTRHCSDASDTAPLLKQVLLITCCSYSAYCGCDVLLKQVLLVTCYSYSAYCGCDVLLEQVLLVTCYSYSAYCGCDVLLKQVL